MSRISFFFTNVLSHFWMQSRTLHVSLVSCALWQFLSLSLSFVTLVFWRILLRHFAEYLSVWVCVMFSRVYTAAMDYVGRILPRWGVLLLVSYGYVCVGGGVMSPTTSHHWQPFSSLPSTYISPSDV